MAKRLVGRSVERKDGVEKVTGALKYASDLTVQGMLYGKILRSPHPYARIVSMDTSRARALPGVHAVLTGEEIHNTYGITVKDCPIFAQGVVMHTGQAVAGVAADTEAIAEKAVSLIDVEYEELKPMLDPFSALESGAPVLHPDIASYQFNPGVTMPEPGTNVCSHYKLRRGDIEEAFARADRVIEGDYSTQSFQHGFLDSITVIATSDPAYRKVDVITGGQSVFGLRKELADCFGVPQGNVRVRVMGIGAAFGGKGYSTIEPHAVALAAAAGRPIKITISRAELFELITRGPAYFHYSTAVNNDGTILGRKLESWWDTGAFAVCGPVIVRNSGHTSAGPYNIPAISIDARLVYTNNIIGVAFRGYGVQEASWATECHMDDIAHELGLDPYDFRKKNLIGYGDQGATGQIVECTGLEACVDNVREGLSRSELPPNTDTVFYGRGMSCFHKATKAPSVSMSLIRVNTDGTIHLLVATNEMGQGAYTVFAQMAAEVLGLEMDDVFIAPSDSEFLPLDGGTGASRSTYTMGNAVVRAAEDLRDQLLRKAPALMGSEPENVRYRFGRYEDITDPAKSYSFKELASRFVSAGNDALVGRGEFSPRCIAPDRETGQTPKMTAFWMYGSQGAEVAVNVGTGEITVRRIVAAHDVGRAIHPLSCHGQIEGAALQGIGSALREEVKTVNGRVVNGNLHDYKMPTCMDIPEYETYIVESVQDDGPFGAKGIGEPALSGTMPAIRNAVFDAIGIQLNSVPMTPEVVVQKWKEREEKAHVVSD